MTGRVSVLAAASTVALAMAAGSAAQAQGFGGVWYGKAFGGMTFPSADDTTIYDGDGDSLASGDLDYDTGYTLGAAVGYNVMPSVAVELEYAYRAADLKGDIFGDTSSNAVMANAIYKFPGMGAAGTVQPYIGAGLGWANVDVSTDDFGNFTRNDGFAYQLIGGVAYAVNPAVSLLGEVRWFGTDTGSVDGDDGVSFDTDFNTFDVLLGMTYSF
jgi:opacity protein-like surface antigen